MSRMKGKANVRIAEGIAPERLLTPSLKVNRDLGGGFGYGRISTVYGTKSAGKTAFCLQSAGIAQRTQDKVVAFMDVEGTFHSEWAERLGVDAAATIYDNPKTVEAVTNSTADAVEAGADIVIIDSVTSMSPTATVEDGEFQGFDKMNALALSARETGKMLLGLNSLMLAHSPAILLISQIRSAKKGIYWVNSATNGKALEFYSSQMLELMSGNGEAYMILDSVLRGNKLLQRTVGRNVDYKVTFNKIGVPYGAGKYQFYFDGDHIGVDVHQEIVELGVELDVIQKAGAWYQYGEKKWQGAKNAADALRSDSDMFNELKVQVDGLL